MSQNLPANKKCRICLIYQPPLISLHRRLKSDGETTILEALQKVMGREIILSENTPDKVCKECLNKLQVSYYLKMKYEQVQRTLLESKMQRLMELLKDNMDGKNNDVDVDEYLKFVGKFKRIVESFDGDNKEGEEMNEMEDPEEYVSDKSPDDSPMTTLNTQRTTEAVPESVTETEENDEFETIIIIRNSDEEDENPNNYKNNWNEKYKEMKALKCDFCSYRTNISAKLKLHSRKQHGRWRTYECQFCNHKTYSKSHYEHHRNRIHKVREVKNIVKEDNDVEIAAEEEMKQGDERNVEECLMSELPSSSGECRINLDDTPDVDEENNKFEQAEGENEIEDFGKTVDHRLESSQTILIVAEDEKLPDLKKHEYRESDDENGIKQYKCNICQAKSSRLNNLRDHVYRIHKRRDVYKCRLCNYSSPIGHDLKRHVRRVHHQIRENKCEMCDYTAVTNFELKCHVKNVHLKIFDIECEHCDYRTNSSSYLKVHTNRKHPDKNKYICDTCNHVAPTKIQLECHKHLTHLKLRTFKCNVCDYKAFTEAFFTRHVENAHKEKKACPFTYCEYRTKYTSHLNRHVSTLHLGEVLGEEPEF